MKSFLSQLLQRPSRHASPRRRFSLSVESLEERKLLTNVLGYHNDLGSTGQNTAETVLTPSNVNSIQFGKLFSVSNLDGYVYTQPLLVTGVQTTAGTDPGLHDVVYVATEHDSLYAIDADNGTMLWQDNFGPSVPSTDVNSGNIVPEIGITGTPVIDPNNNTLYLVAETLGTVSGTNQYVQQLHAIDITSGAEKFGGPVVIGKTTNPSNNTFINNTQIYVYGTGDGTDSVTDPYNGTGKQVVQFNAMRELQRSALTYSQVNNAVYIPYASNNDTTPYHGWILAYDPGTLALKGVFNDTPNGSQGGIWESGGGVVENGSNLYFETGNGTFDGGNGDPANMNSTSPAPGPVTGLDGNGFPVNGDYGDSFVNISPDTTSTPTNQNKNGWGLKVADYFTPYNQLYLSTVDQDLGSGGPTLVPDSAFSGGFLIIGGGKEGRIYLINPTNMGKFNVSDHVLQETDAIPGEPPGGQGLFASPAFFNNSVYFGGSVDSLTAFSVSSAPPSFTTSPTSKSSHTFNYPGPTPSVSANGSSAGIVWALDNSGYGSNSPAVLYAYDATNLNKELYDSTQAANNRDQAAGAVKFTVPTVANGKVYVGGEFGLTVYGLLPQAAQEVAINAGGGAAGSFVADTDFSGGSTYSNTDPIDTSGVTNPAPQAVYDTERYGNFTYTIPNLTAGANYTVRLDFAEIYWNSAGQRVFNVAINGTQVLSNFDIFAAAGGKDKAIAEQFTTTANSSGRIVIQFTSVKDNAKLSGLEIIPSPTVLAINAGGGAAGSFVADTDFSGGSTYSNTDPIDTSGVTNPAPQAVYDTERYGNFTYTIPNLTAGANYTVRLDFAEIYWNSAGQRVFNVAINGTQVLSNFDIFAAAGGKDKAIAEQFTTTANSSGRIVIQFTSVKDNAKLSGLEIIPSPTVLAINAGGGAAGSFVADTDFSGGSTYSNTDPIDTSGVTNPAPQAVYDTERYGNFTYTIPNLTAGANYTVRLDFAEIYWNSAGQRVFNVAINGTQVLSNFDIFAAAGGKDKAIAEQFTTTANSSGRIVIQFTSVKDNAKLSGLEILQA